MSDVSDPMLVDQPDDTPAIRQVRDALRASQARNAQLTADAQAGATATKENVFLKAGVDTSSPVGELLFTSYNGDLDVETVRAQAERLGAVMAPTPPPAPVTSDDDARLQALQTGLGGSGDGTPGEPVDTESMADPWTDAIATFNARRTEGKDGDRAAAEALGIVFGAAVAGDERVLFDNERWKEQFNG